jgi:TldD protein
VPWVNPQAGGYEALASRTLLDDIEPLYEEARRQLTAKPVTIGRFDVVFDATAMASIISQSIGAATEIDRVRGFEANAGGTSYLGPASETLGTALGGPLLTLHADRTDPKGAATVGWDDDGVAPDQFTLVRDGKVVDFATSREHVGEMAAWYAAQKVTPSSHGCAASSAGSRIPMVQTPNVRMAPAARDASFEELLAGVKDGLAVVGGECAMDFRKLTGQGQAEVMYEVTNGKLGQVVSGGAYLIRSPEFWKGVAAIGGAGSAMRRGFYEAKGQPFQLLNHTVTAVPALVRGIAVIDVSKRLA